MKTIALLMNYLIDGLINNDQENKMKKQKILSVIAVAAFMIVSLFGCKDPGISDPYSGANANHSGFMQLAAKSTTVNSFQPNYNEQQAMALTGSMGKDIYPIKIGQHMKLTDQNLTLVKDSTTATGTLVQKWSGTLVIQGSLVKPTVGVITHVDTTVEKPFSTTITRIIKYERIANTGNDTTDWKIVAVSLPNGGTEGTDVQISKITLTAQDGSTLEITDPNQYFFNVGSDKDGTDDDDYKEFNNGLSMRFGAEFGTHGMRGLFTWYRQNQPVKISVEILSTSSDPDFLTITYGAEKDGRFRTKEQFDLVSSTLQGSYFKKVYEKDWYTNPYPGIKHAVINVFPRNVVYDTDTSVQEKSWGIPYRVQ